MARNHISNRSTRSRPYRVRPPTACCRDHAADASPRSTVRCHVGAGRSSVRPEHTTRRTGRCLVDRPAESAVIRRPKASPRRATTSDTPAQRRPKTRLAIRSREPVHRQFFVRVYRASNHQRFQPIAPAVPAPSRRSSSREIVPTRHHRAAAHHRMSNTRSHRHTVPACRAATASTAPLLPAPDKNL